MLVINTNSKGLLQLEWCPTRPGILAVISKDEPNIKLWDVKDVFTQVSQMKEGSPEAVAATESLTKPSRSKFCFDDSFSLSLSHFYTLDSNSFDFVSCLSNNVHPNLFPFFNCFHCLRNHLTEYDHLVVEVAEPISSFSWSPHDEYKLIHITYNGNVEIMNLHESIPLSFSPKCELAVADGKKMFEGSLLPLFLSHTSAQSK